MLQGETVKFLKDLEKNNNREWFTANRKRFDDANDNVIAITDYLIGQIARFDPAVESLDPKMCVFRIYRDVRFSKDKSPYKTNLGAFIAPGGRKAMAPGYYFHIQPAMFFAAAGKHLPDPREQLRIRTAIANDHAAFRKIVEAKKFIERFGGIEAERLSRPPKGFSPDHEAIEYLKLKSFTVSQTFSQEEAKSPEYPKLLAESYKAAFPLVCFLRKALA